MKKMSFLLRERKKEKKKNNKQGDYGEVIFMYFITLPFPNSLLPSPTIGSIIILSYSYRKRSKVK